MSLGRREFLQLLALAGAAGLAEQSRANSNSPNDSDIANTLYRNDFTSSVRLLHITDSHAQLEPVFFREPNVNIGLGSARARPPHLVGHDLLARFGLSSDALLQYALTHIDFSEAARRYGKVGGFAHLATLLKRLRGEAGDERTLLLDGGDTWQGSWTALQTRGADMVEASNLLGVDIMTGHWEFTYTADEIHANIERSNCEFIAQNIAVKEEALFDGSPAYNEDSGHAFKPYTVRTLAGGHRLAVIGQAFPYTPIANPSRFIPDWTFGIQEEALQTLVSTIRRQEKPDAIVLLSHNGMDVDLKLASRVTGIDVILGGHTHDGVPAALPIKNRAGTTLVTNAGSNGKFIGVMDLQLAPGRVTGYRYRLVPVFANYIDADVQMQTHIDTVREPHLAKLNETLGHTEELLYRRGNFNGSFDQLICDALMATNDAQAALSPGFRWGTSILPDSPITFERVADQTAMTYPETYARDMSGEQIKLILEDVADNLFNLDPFRQQGGDMVRLGGMRYTLDPTAAIGRRIHDLRLVSGELVSATKSYRVAGWATVASQADGPPVWQQVSEYLRDQKTVRMGALNSPRLVNINDNPGVTDYAPNA